MAKMIEMKRWLNGNGADLEITSEYGAYQLVSLNADDVGKVIELLAGYRVDPKPIFAGLPTKRGRAGD